MFYSYGLIFLVICFYLKTAAAVNYCAANLCPAGKPNIACNNNGAFLAKCPKNAKMVSLVPYQTLILQLHNSKRNLIATGGVSGYKQATRMATMQWNNELAQMAAYNVKQCVMQHDKCRNTPTFKQSGQNLAIISYTGNANTKTDKELITNRVNAWWNEYKNCNMSFINKYPATYTGPDIGHFTVFVAQKNTRVGCAAVRFTVGQTNSFLIACNYATTNVYGKPIYTAGAAASGCKTGHNSAYPGLCSKSEVYAL